MVSALFKRTVGRSFPLTGVALLMGLLWVAGTGWAADLTWVGPSNGDWFASGNWNPAQAPNTGDTVFITNGYVLLSNTSAPLASLTITNASLIFTNWGTRLDVTNVVVLNKGILTLPPAYTNAEMSNRVYVICSNFFLASGGKIDVAGMGYRGTNRTTGSGPGAGTGGDRGSGAGHGGRGGRSSTGHVGGNAYGSTNMPETPGSGGGCRSGGGGPSGNGGGVVRMVASGQVTINGLIDASGKNASAFDAGGGSGGSIYITAQSFDGTNGSILADGGSVALSGNDNQGGGGAGGRIAMEAVSVSPSHTVSFSARRGTGWFPGEYGSLWFSTNAFLSAAPRSLAGLIVLPEMEWTVNSLTVTNGSIGFMDGFRATVNNDVLISGANAELIVGGHRRAFTEFRCGGNLVLTNSAKCHLFSAPTNGLATTYGALLAVDGRFQVSTGSWVFPVSSTNDGGTPLVEVGYLTVASNAGFNAAGLGWESTWAGTGQGIGPGVGGDRGSGGGHGGRGGKSSSGNAGGQSYDSTNAPIQPGSGAGARAGGSQGSGGGRGGGAIRVIARETVRLEGTMNADGLRSWVFDSGGGAGGSIFVICRFFEGGTQAVMSAIGGNSPSNTVNQGGGGGGGRIAVWHQVGDSSERNKILQAPDDPQNFPRMTIRSNDFSETRYEGSVTATNGLGKYEPPSADAAQPGTIIVLRVLQSHGIFINIF